MKKIVFLSCFLLGLLLFARGTAIACVCFGDPDQTIRQKVNADKASAHLVFSGKVVEVRRNSSDPGFTTRISVERSWKDLARGGPAPRR